MWISPCSQASHFRNQRLVDASWARGLSCDARHCLCRRSHLQSQWSVWHMHILVTPVSVCCYGVLAWAGIPTAMQRMPLHMSIARLVSRVPRAEALRKGIPRYGSSLPGTRPSATAHVACQAQALFLSQAALLSCQIVLYLRLQQRDLQEGWSCSVSQYLHEWL